MAVVAVLPGGALAFADPENGASTTSPDFGPNVVIFTPSMSQADALEVNSDNTIIDDLWIWRADHGVPGSVGWTVNTADTGLVVNGDHVTATGLFVEHFQKYNVIWNGNDGEDIFFQNELSFQGYGMGSYIFTNVDPDIHVSHAFEVPNTPGVQMHDLLTINLSGPGTIDHVINDAGGPVGSANADVASQVVSYPAGG